MRHRTTPRFRALLGRLPPRVREAAHRNFDRLKKTPEHPSLRFKKVGGSLWSVRIGRDYRAVATEDAADLIWIWIGKHDEYERILQQRG